MNPRSLPLLPAIAALLANATAQSNAIAGRDLRLADTWWLDTYVRAGTFPNGASAIGAWTTCCNPGTSPVPFQAAMSPNHGYIHYLLARESDGRLVQISDWGYVKHTFGSSNDPSVCGSCAGPGNFNQVEVGCSDTYANYQAVNHWDLGPPEEIDPWLGTWDPVCSHFDRGEPEGAPATLCDGVRSLDPSQVSVLNAALNHQVRVYDVDLNVAGATFWFQAGYFVPAEPEANRGNNHGSRQFTPAWNGSAWQISDGPSFLQGTILQRWSGASIASNTNGTDDGRFYVAVKVTGPTDGRYHYEYAVHNRDNKRGMGAFRVPVCSGAHVENFGFHDVDQDGTNQWIGAKVGGEVVFQTVANPLRWNSIFNFWFDSDAAPLAGSAQLDQFDLGPGSLSVAVATTIPGGLYNVDLGPGCGNPVAPLLHATGTPDRAAIPNATFGLRSTGNPAGALCGFLLVDGGSTLLAPGCTLYASSLTAVSAPLMTLADGAGVAVMALPVPNAPAFEGTALDLQMANIAPGGAYLGSFNLSNGLRVRIGNLIGGCP